MTGLVVETNVDGIVGCGILLGAGGFVLFISSEDAEKEEEERDDAEKTRPVAIAAAPEDWRGRWLLLLDDDGRPRSPRSL